LAIIGVIAAPITSGDTALRSARLIIADFMHIEQRTIPHRLEIALPLFISVFGMIFVDFNVIWRYFAWTNQTLACFTLWAGAVWLYKKGQGDKVQSTKYRYGYMIALFPAVFMTMVCCSYILIAPEGLNIAPDMRWLGYVIAGIMTIVCLDIFTIWARRQRRK
jgi:carbon starvation protein CstA